MFLTFAETSRDNDTENEVRLSIYLKPNHLAFKIKYWKKTLDNEAPVTYDSTLVIWFSTKISAQYFMICVTRKVRRHDLIVSSGFKI